MATTAGASAVAAGPPLQTAGRACARAHATCRRQAQDCHCTPMPKFSCRCGLQMSSLGIPCRCGMQGGGYAGVVEHAGVARRCGLQVWNFRRGMQVWHVKGEGGRSIMQVWRAGVKFQARHAGVEDKGACSGYESVAETCCMIFCVDGDLQVVALAAC
eukprot:350730-Chlamydomonas_euryale.AAC.10